MRHDFTPTFEKRFWAKVDQSGGPDACWIWRASTDGCGRGEIQIGVRGQGKIKAHRAAFLLANGEIPDDLPHVCHSCDTPLCCNPSHLFAGTRSDNMRDMYRKGRKTNSRNLLTDDEIRQIRTLYASGCHSHRSIASKFSVTNGTVCKVINRNGRYAEVA